MAELTELESERLKALTNQMVEAISSPEYVEAMRAVKSASKGKKIDEAMRRLTPESLRAQGVKLPEGMRISSRYFEPDFKQIEVGDVAGARNMLKEIHSVDPDLLNRIEQINLNNPDLFDSITRTLSPDIRDVSPLAFCGCASGGVGGICGGVGAGG